MPRKRWDPRDPEVLVAILERIHNMTREEWLKELAWRPEGVEETWRMQKVQDTGLPKLDGALPAEATVDEMAAPDPAAVASTPEVPRR